MRILNYEVKQKIKVLSGKCFWFWNDFYGFYSNILWMEKKKLEILYPKSNNKFIITEQILDKIKVDELDKLFSEFFNLKEPLWWDKNHHYNEAKGLLKEFKEYIKVDVLKEKENKKEFEKEIEKVKVKDKEKINKTIFLENIKNKFFEYSAKKDIEQKRWYWIEKIFFDILELENIDSKRPYKNKWEQIDGHLKFNTFDYLIEIKWTKESVKQKEISEFDWKIDWKAQSTRWIFFSVNWFSDSAITQVKKRNPRIFFIDVLDFISVLEERRSIYDIFLEKENNLVTKWIVYNEN